MTTYLIVETNVIKDSRGTTYEHNDRTEFENLKDAEKEFEELSKEKAVKMSSSHKETWLQLGRITDYTYNTWHSDKKNILPF